MKTLITGNGVNIQFSNKEYLNNQILMRAIKNLDTGNFNESIYPKEIGHYLIQLLLFSKEILSGAKDVLVATTYEQITLPEFKNRNKKSIKTMDFSGIGLEDYFFIHHMFCRDQGINNPERFHITKSLERLFLDSIYNNGQINEIHKSFSKEFILWLEQFDNVFTTNYDSNIDHVINQPVYHLHGSFLKLSDVYNSDSLRSKLGLDEYDFIEGHNHLYCDAMFDFSGYGKEFAGLQAERANSALEKFSKVLTDENLKDHKKEIDSWENSNNSVLRNFHKAIYAKNNNPEIQFEEHYHFNRFTSIKGEITFLGLSPYNDSHIIDMVRKNEDINKITYYYYSYIESEVIDFCFPDKDVNKINVKNLWKKFESFV